MRWWYYLLLVVGLGALAGLGMMIWSLVTTSSSTSTSGTRGAGKRKGQSGRGGTIYGGDPTPESG